MTKIKFFPYHPDMELIARHENQLSPEYKIAEFSSFKEDKKAVGRLNSLLSAPDTDYDAVVLLDDYRDCIPDKYYAVMDDTIAAGKEIYIVPDMARRLELENYSGKYQILDCQPNLAKGIEFQLEQHKMYTSDVPILTVLGQGQNSGKFETQLFIKKVLEDMGYTPAVISSNPLGALFGCYTMPSFFYDNSLEFERRIIDFNHYIYKLSRLEIPDIIILGVPGGATPFTTSAYNQFGLFTHMVTSAVTSDLSVISTYYDYRQPIGDGEFSAMAENFRGRFGITLNAASVGSIGYEYSNDPRRYVIYDYLDDGYISRHPYDESKLGSKVFLLRENNERARDIVESMINSLTGNLNLV